MRAGANDEEFRKNSDSPSDIHGIYKGQQYGGISTPAEFPYVFIFTSEAGEAYGYNDGYGADDTFWYTGEGQEGDMRMSNGNRAIREHKNTNKRVLLFESVESGAVRYVGNCEYITHHIEERPDKNGDLRNAIIFHLDVESFSNVEIQEPTEGYDSEQKPTLTAMDSEAKAVSPR
ncbi:hypothetical protein BOW53_10595 [Solemya pervernicosa gill symbiont]|uniref:ScoMcrA-like SRA domain-containing protein n=1 Tax=Solemya pervernicosa gill symbiont TaxID=642797 RepID=A0A1T2L3N6_9GAMM|nr:hypothetical protein [Solemya pervernicosa gill symbiont]OOZ39701.1 hypothetical protein BOW53_10595 [Solemya pervernicosa gill symbiont]